MSESGSIKEQFRRVLDKLPEDATWDDVFYHIYVQQSIEAGLKDCREGRTLSIPEVRKRLGLQS